MRRVVAGYHDHQVDLVALEMQNWEQNVSHAKYAHVHQPARILIWPVGLMLCLDAVRCYALLLLHCKRPETMGTALTRLAFGAVLEHTFWSDRVPASTA